MKVTKARGEKKNWKCFFFGHQVKSRYIVRNHMWGKPMGEPRFYFRCTRCGLKDVVDLPYITTGNAESERWGEPISKLGRKIGMAGLNKYDGDYYGYHGRGMYTPLNSVNKLKRLLTI